MQYKHRMTLIFAALIAIFLAFSIVVDAADNDPVTVTGILKAAECPLTEEQQKAINDLDASDGFMAMMSVNQIFNDEQTDALVAVLGERTFPGGGMGGPDGGMGGGGMEMPRMVNNLFQVVIFEKEGVPMTEKQVAELKDLEMGPETMQRMSEIFTAEQTEAMQKYIGNMGGGMGSPGGGMGGMR